MYLRSFAFWTSIAFALLLIQFEGYSQAGVFESAQDGNWTTAATWTQISGSDADGIPDSDDNATILDTHDITNGASFAVNNLTIDADGTLTYSGTNADLSVGGDLTVDGIITFTGNNTDLIIDGDLTVNGTISSSAPGPPGDIVLQTASKTIDGTGLISMAGGDIIEVQVDCDFPATADITIDVVQLNLDGGITMTNSGTVTLSANIAKSGGGGSAFWTQNANSVLNVAGSFNVNIDISASAEPNNVNYDGAGNQNIGVPTDSYYNLSLSGGGTKIQLSYAPARSMQIDKDLSIDGASTFDPNGEKVVIGGSTAQTITGDFIFFDLTINNSYATNPQISSSGSHTITNSGTFADGVINNTGSITFDDATASSTANSYIDGPVVFIANTNTSFNYPVGDGDIWARLGVGSLTALSQFTAQYFDSSPLVAFGTAIDGTDFNPATTILSGSEYWTLSYDGGGASSAIVTLYWEDGTRSEITDLSDLTITKWDGSDWGNDGGITTGTTGAPAAGTVFSNSAYTTFSPFTFASPNGNNPLPVELINFNSELCENGVKLFWETASEENNDYFNVESSTNGETFQKIARIQGIGNSSKINSYEYYDQFPVEGINYYRLKQTDYDGTYTYSKTVSIYVESIPFNIVVYPNPVLSGKFSLAGNLKSNQEPVDFRIINSLGKMEVSKIIQPVDSRILIEFNTNLPSGIYFVELRQGGYKRVKRVIIY